MSSRSIHVAASIRMSIVSKAERWSAVWADHMSLSIIRHRRLGGFQLLPTVTGAAVNRRVQVWRHSKRRRPASVVPFGLVSVLQATGWLSTYQACLKKQKRMRRKVGPGPLGTLS